MICWPDCLPPIVILNWADLNKLADEVNDFDLIILNER